MVLESTIICVDNSEYMRNGDFLPTRLQAQQDAVNMVAQSKLRSNPESNVGLLTLGGLEVLSTLTTDSAKVLAKMTGVKPSGELMLIPGIRIAHLALKHRLGKNHKTRIVAFVGSPVQSNKEGEGFEKELIKLGKKLKKEKVNIDIISFGEVEENEEVLQKFIETVNGRDGGSHYVAIPVGPHLSDALLSSPILQGEDGAAAPGQNFEFGVDPYEDPELALALRVSMEEQRQRQEAGSGQTGGEQSSSSVPSASSAPSGGSGQDDEQLLQRALEMSMAGESGTSASGGEPDLASMSEEQQIAYAMRMSMQDSEPAGAGAADDKMEVDEPEPEKKSEEEDYSEVMNDPQYLQSVLENLPGVDPQSDAVKKAVGAMTASESSDKNKKDKDCKKDKKDDDKK